MKIPLKKLNTFQSFRSPLLPIISIKKAGKVRRLYFTDTSGACNNWLTISCQGSAD